MSKIGWDKISMSHSGSRAEKKRRTREGIIANAVALFVEIGIRQTRSSAIAQASEISPATLFNYFTGKQELVEAWIRGELTALIEKVANEPSDRALRSRLRLACSELASVSFEQRRPRIEAWQVLGRAPTSRFARLPALEKRLAKEQAEGRLRSDLDARRIASLVVEAFEGGLIDALERASDVREAEHFLRARVDLVLDGARKRNERVRASAVASTPPDSL